MNFAIKNLSGYFDGYNFHLGPIDFIIEGSKISAIGKGIAPDDAIDGFGKFIAPGFVDAHTHLIYAGSRSFELPMKVAGATYAEIFEAGGGIYSTVDASRAASDDELLTNVLLRLDQMLVHGSHVVEAKSGYGLSKEQELRQLRILNKANELHPINVVVTYCGAHAFPKEISKEAYVQDVIDFIPTVVKENLASSIDVFCDRGAFSVEQTERIFDEAMSHNLPIRVHGEEIEYTGIGVIAAQKYHALSVDHCLLSGQADFRAYAKYGTVANFMPAAILGLFSTQYPTGWKEENVTIGLGTDHNPNNVVTSMQTAIRLGSFLYKMRPVDAFRAAISGSYKGVFGKEFLALQEGSPANFNILRGDDINEFSSNFDCNSVTHVVMNGEILVENKIPEFRN